MVNIKDLNVGDEIIVEENDELAPTGPGVVEMIISPDSDDPIVMYTTKDSNYVDSPDGWLGSPKYILKVEY